MLPFASAVRGGELSGQSRSILHLAGPLEAREGNSGRKRLFRNSRHFVVPPR
jgi:hypothetical protein